MNLAEFHLVTLGEGNTSFMIDVRAFDIVRILSLGSQTRKLLFDSLKKMCRGFIFELLFSKLFHLLLVGNSVFCLDLF